MSVDSELTQLWRATQGNGKELSFRGAGGLQQKDGSAEEWGGCGWVQCRTRKEMEQHRGTEREGNWRVGECRRSHSSSALEISNLSLSERKSDAK